MAPGDGFVAAGIARGQLLVALAQVAQLLQAFQRAQHGTARAMAMRRDGVDRRPRAAPVVVIRPSRQIHQHELLRQAQLLVLQLPRPLLRRPAHRASSPRPLASWSRSPMRSPSAAARHNAHTTSRHTTIATTATAATARPISGAPAATARRTRGMQQHRQQVCAGDPHAQRWDGSRGSRRTRCGSDGRIGHCDNSLSMEGESRDSCHLNRPESRPRLSISPAPSANTVRSAFVSHVFPGPVRPDRTGEAVVLRNQARRP